ncbi:MAG TPA: ribonuclease III [Candidatus Scybalocola faecavium]|nr:ribonuclease III [Candidatus Scybalocola faecavium]
MEKSIEIQASDVQGQPGHEEIESFHDKFKRLFGLRPVDVRAYSPLTLAYLGDAVFEVLIRSLIVERSNAPVNKLHKRSSTLVKASAQAALVKAVEPRLSEEELSVYKRGRNAKSYTMAKHATMTDYRMATGLEALVGYLYLKQDYDRILELIRFGLETMGEIPSKNTGTAEHGSSKKEEK